MATFTISLSGSSVVNGSKNWTVSDADVQILVNFLANRFSTPPNAQALAAWTQDFVSSTINQVRSFQQTQAIVTPITFT
jgi:hypothetical protein